jgi:hypothetical protein
MQRRIQSSSYDARAYGSVLQFKIVIVPGTFRAGARFLLSAGGHSPMLPGDLGSVILTVSGSYSAI